MKNLKMFPRGVWIEYKYCWKLENISTWGFLKLNTVPMEAAKSSMVLLSFSSLKVFTFTAFILEWKSCWCSIAIDLVPVRNIQKKYFSEPKITWLLVATTYTNKTAVTSYKQIIWNYSRSDFSRIEIPIPTKRILSMRFTGKYEGTTEKLTK